MNEGKWNRKVTPFRGELHFLRCEIYGCFWETPVNSYQTARHHKVADCVSLQYRILKSTEKGPIVDELTDCVIH